MRETDYNYKAKTKTNLKDTPNLDIEHKIEVFLDMTLPSNASQVQINETRKAFIAGLYQCFGDMMTISAMKEDFAEKEMDKYHTNINKCIKKYIKQ